MSREERRILNELEDIHARFAEIGEKMTTGLRDNTETLARLDSKMALLDDLAREVSENTSVVQSVVALVGGLRDKVLALQATAQANGASAETIAAAHELAAQLDANSNTLAALVAQNTPAPSEPAPTPAEPVVPATPEEPAPVDPAPAPEADPAAPVATQPEEVPAETPPAEPTP